MIRRGAYLIAIYICHWYFFTSASAQQFHAGLLAGLSTTQVDGDSYAGYDKTGFWAGGFVRTKISTNKRWSAAFELSYIQKGSRKIPNPDNNDYTEYFLKLNYVEVPVLLRYDFSVRADSANRKRLKLAIEGGFAVGKLVSYKEYDASGFIPWKGVPFEQIDYSYVLGLSYFVFPKTEIIVRTEYSLFPFRHGGNVLYYQNWLNRRLKPGFYNNLMLFCIRQEL